MESWYCVAPTTGRPPYHSKKLPADSFEALPERAEGGEQHHREPEGEACEQAHRLPLLLRMRQTAANYAQNAVQPS